MWKSIFKCFTLVSLAACGQELEITPSTDLNRLYHDSDRRVFAVKEGWFQKAECSEFENWVQINMPNESDYYYYFVRHHKELTQKGNPYLKSEYDALITGHVICIMRSDEKKCFYCDITD